MKNILKDLKRKIKNKDWDYVNPAGETLLLQAMKLGKLRLAIQLIKNEKIDIRKPAKDYTTALFYAIICHNLKLVKMLLKAGEEIDPKNCSSLGAPLLWASRAGANSIIDFLIKNGASIDRQTTPMKYTALMGACFTLKEKTIEKLVHLGANVSLRNKEKMTALDIYSRSGGRNPKIEEILKR